jgi:hypothetical protein
MNQSKIFDELGVVSLLQEAYSAKYLYMIDDHYNLRKYSLPGLKQLSKEPIPSLTNYRGYINLIVKGNKVYLSIMLSDNTRLISFSLNTVGDEKN